jgi:hypothetical protein
VSLIIALYAGMMLMLAWWLTSTATWSLALFALLFGAFYGGRRDDGPDEQKQPVFFGGMHDQEQVRIQRTRSARMSGKNDKN